MDKKDVPENQNFDELLVKAVTEAMPEIKKTERKPRS